MGRDGLIEFARELGLRLVVEGPDHNGWWRCRAYDREDRKPSASINVITGYYHDHGSDEGLSIFDLATAMDPESYPDFPTTVNALGDRYIGEPEATGAGADVAAVVDVAGVRGRLAEVIQSGDLARLYSAPGLLADLAAVRAGDKAAYAELMVPVRRMKGFREGDFDDALVEQGPREVAAGEPEERGRRGDAAVLIGMGSTDVDLFHAPGGKPYATITVNGHRETHAVRSKCFASWLKGAFYAAHDRLPGSDTFGSALDVLELLAGQGPEHAVHVRTAEVPMPEDPDNPTYFLNLADADWRAIQISRQGWTVAENVQPRFRRPGGMLALPVPVRGGSLADLWRFVNVAKEDRVLYLAYLLAALRPTGPYPILILAGEQGSAKTATSEVTRRLIDPHVTLLQPPPREDRELIIAASSSGVLAYDNVSHMQDWLSDALCRISTGSGFSCRQLYSDDEQVHMVACRPILINGIEDVVSRGDLLQRALILDLPVISEHRRLIDTDLRREFALAQPRIFGALLDAMVNTLAALPGTRLGRLPRMADFARWGEASSRAQGRREGEFLAAYARNQSRAMEITLDSSPVALAALAMMAEREVWEGTAQGLLTALEDRVPTSTRTRHWPASPRGMGGALRRAAPAMRGLGVLVEFGRASDKDRARIISPCAAWRPARRGRPDPSEDLGPVDRGRRPDRPSSKMTDAGTRERDGADASDGRSPLFEISSE